MTRPMTCRVVWLTVPNCALRCPLFTVSRDSKVAKRWGGKSSNGLKRNDYTGKRASVQRRVTSRHSTRTAVSAVGRRRNSTRRNARSTCFFEFAKPRVVRAGPGCRLCWRSRWEPPDESSTRHRRPDRTKSEVVGCLASDRARQPTRDCDKRQKTRAGRTCGVRNEYQCAIGACAYVAAVWDF